MLLTRIQGYILDLLIKLKCMKTSQLYWFLRHCYGLTNEQIDRQIRQLRYLGKIRIEDEYVLLYGRDRDDELIIAVDIMIEFCDEGLPSFCEGTPPCKLVFFTQTEDEKVNVFKLIFVPMRQEIILSLEAQKQNQPPDHTVLFYLQDKSQIPLLLTTHNAYFVIADGKGGHTFYK